MPTKSYNSNILENNFNKTALTNYSTTPKQVLFMRYEIILIDKDQQMQTIIITEGSSTVYVQRMLLRIFYIRTTSQRFSVVISFEFRSWKYT